MVALCLIIRTKVCRAKSASLMSNLRRNQPPSLHNVDFTDDESIQSDMDMNLLEVSLQASEFKLPDHLIKRGEQSGTFVSKSDGRQVDKHARLIGLPPQLTTEIYDFVVHNGLMDAFRDVLYSDDSHRGSRKSRILNVIKANGKWAVTSPGNGSNWSNSDLHWFDVVDEAAFEETLQVLKRGGFDTVLDAIGSEFNNDSLMIAAMGFIVVSHSKDARRHADDSGVQGRFLDILFPLVLLESDASQLFIGDEKDAKRMAPLQLHKE